MARTTFQVSVDLLRNRSVGFENRSIVAVLKTVRQMQMCLKWSVPLENAPPSGSIVTLHVFSANILWPYDIKCATFFTSSYKFLFCSRKPLPGFLLCIFSSVTYLKKPVFNKRDLLLWKVLARLYWDLLTSGRYQPACHYFWKVKQNPSSALRRKRT